MSVKKSLIFAGLVLCWMIIFLQSTFIVLVKYPGALVRLGIHDQIAGFFQIVGMRGDPWLEISRDRTRLIEALRQIDEHSTVLSEEQFESFSIDTRQEYVGIGVSLLSAPEGAEIRHVFEGGPGQRAGLEVGDFITHIDGMDISGWPFRSVVNQLRGSEGTELVLDVLRSGQILTTTLQRGSVHIPSINRVHLTDQGLLYLKIEQFGEKTSREFVRHLAEHMSEGLTGIVIDLRDNTGGTFRSSLEILDTFHHPGEVMLTSRHTRWNRVRQHQSRRQGPLADLPTYFLVNRHSASASEILAGSLQASGRAIVIGEQTMGKGSIQSVFSLDDGAAYKKTTSHFYLPNGVPVQGEGIVPDIALSISATDYRNYRLRERAGIAPFETDEDPWWNALLEWLNQNS